MSHPVLGVILTSSAEVRGSPLLRQRRGIQIARRWTLYLPVMIAATVACAVALSAVSENAEATFPGKNGRIAYSGYDGNDYEIYTIKAGGRGKTKLTHNTADDAAPSWGSSP